MTTSHLGTAPPAWLPPSALSLKTRAKPDPAVRGRRLVRGWLRHLGDVGVTLVAGIRALARLRAEAGGQAEVAPIDINLGWVLVRRATRWMAALRFRIAAETAAARPRMDAPALLDPLVQTLAAAEAEAKKALRRRRAAERPKPERGARAETHEVRQDNCIDGIPTAAVLAQVCADLGAAATVLVAPDARRLIETIAAEARAMLGESTVALLPEPRVLGRFYSLPPPQTPQTPQTPQAALAGTTAPPPAPGTG